MSGCLAVVSVVKVAEFWNGDDDQFDTETQKLQEEAALVA